MGYVVTAGVGFGACQVGADSKPKSLIHLMNLLNTAQKYVGVLAGLSLNT